MENFAKEIAADFFANLETGMNEDEALDKAIAAKKQRDAESFERIIDDMNGDRVLAGVAFERALTTV